MKLLVTADLHYGASKSGNACIEALAERACSEPADVLLLGGDLGEGMRGIDACLRLFEGFSGTRMAVPGNHDIWDRRTPTQAWPRHEELLPVLFESHGFHPLHQRPTRVGDVGFVGSMGWYDYSFQDDIGIDRSCYESKIYPGSPGPRWNDARYAHLPYSDPELTELLGERLREQLDQVGECRQIVALVHHVISKRLLFHPRFLVPREWRFLNAFLGAEQLGEVLAADPRVTQAFCGHIHRARAIQHNGAIWSTIGSDYDPKELLFATETEIVKREVFE